MRSPRVASPGSAIARMPVSKSIAIARGRMRFIVGLHRFLGGSFKNGRALTAERRARSRATSHLQGDVRPEEVGRADCPLAKRMDWRQTTPSSSQRPKEIR